MEKTMTSLHSARQTRLLPSQSQMSSLAQLVHTKPLGRGRGYVVRDMVWIRNAYNFMIRAASESEDVLVGMWQSLDIDCSDTGNV